MPIKVKLKFYRRNHIPVKLPLTDETEMESYFIQEAKQLLALKSEITKADKEIDRMVYEFMYERRMR